MSVTAQLRGGVGLILPTDFEIRERDGMAPFIEASRERAAGLSLSLPQRSSSNDCAGPL